MNSSLTVYLVKGQNAWGEYRESSPYLCGLSEPVRSISTENPVEEGGQTRWCSMA